VQLNAATSLTAQVGTRLLCPHFVDAWRRTTFAADAQDRPKSNLEENEMLRYREAPMQGDPLGGRPAGRRIWGVAWLRLSACLVALLVGCGGGVGTSSSATPQAATVPGAPSGVTVTAGDNESTLNWGAVAGATSYNVYRSTTQGSLGTKIGASTGTSYVDTSASNGTTYYYQVTADNAAGEGSASSQSGGVTPAVPVAVPAAPAGLSATAGNAQVTLTWTVVGGARSYNVYRSTNASSQGSKIGSSSTTQYVDTAVSNGSTYYYAVTADNAAGEGPASAQSASATPAVPLAVPAAPTALNALAGDALVTLSWTAAPTATAYKVYRSTILGTQGSLVGTSATTGYSDASAINGATYYYVVTSANAAGESAPSAQSAAATPQVPLTRPPAPTGVNATAGNAQVTLGWTAAAHATSYNVYRSTAQGTRGSLLGTSAGTSYSDTTAANGTTYYYTVTGTNKAGEGAASAQSAAATPKYGGDGGLRDSNINYIGRWDKSNSATYRSYWNGSYLSTKFTGTTVKVKLAEKTVFRAFIDGVPSLYWDRVGTIDLTPTPLANGTHTLKIVAAYEKIELPFQGLVLDAGASTVRPDTLPLVEFIGDSITTGITTTDVVVSDYAWLTGERMGAEHTQISYPGITLSDGYHYSDNTFPGMESLYFKLWQANRCPDVACTGNPAWNFANYTAKLVVVNLGSNDAFNSVPSATFQSRYTAFLQNIRAKFPNADIFALRTLGGYYPTETQAAVNARVNAGDAKVHYVDTTGWLDSSTGSTDFTDGVHPSDAGHVKVTNRLLPILLPYLGG